MEPKSSLPHSQVPATCPYPELDRSSACPHIPLSEDPSLYYPLIYAWAFQVVTFPQVSPTTTLYTPLIAPIRATCPANLILLHLNGRNCKGKKIRKQQKCLGTAKYNVAFCCFLLKVESSRNLKII